MIRTYPDAIGFSFALAVVGGLFAVWSGYAVVNAGRVGRLMGVAMLVVGFLPGALIGGVSQQDG